MIKLVEKKYYTRKKKELPVIITRPRPDSLGGGEYKYKLKDWSSNKEKAKELAKEERKKKNYFSMVRSFKVEGKDVHAVYSAWSGLRLKKPRPKPASIKKKKYPSSKQVMRKRIIPKD